MTTKPTARIAPLLLVGTIALGMPAAARAYGVQHATLVRMSALVAWRGGREVLVLSPVVREVGGGGALVVPLPPGAKEVPAPAGWPPEAKTPAPTPPGPPPGSKAGRIGKVPRLRLPRFHRVVPPVRPPGKVRSVSRRRLRGLPAGPLDAEAAKGWRFAVVALPDAGKAAVRVGPVAFAFAAKLPRVPLRLAAALPAHTLDLTVLAPGAIPDLGGMDFAFGLRRAPARAVPPALARWAKARVGLAAPVESEFAAPAVNGTLRPVSKVDLDLTLPVPRTSGTAADGGAGGARPPGPRPVHRPPTARASGCGSCATASGPGGVAGLLVLCAALASRRRRR